MPPKQTIQPFVVSFGAEGFFLDRDLERARLWKDRNVVRVDGEEVNDEDLVSICETRYFDGRDLVVVLDDAQKVKGDKALKAYVADKSPTDGSTVLVVIVRSEKLPEIWAQAAKKGKIFEHKKFKTWDNNNEVVKWAGSEAMRLELGLDKGVPELLFQLTGGDLYKVASELRKLQILVGKGNKATVAHLKMVLSPSPSAEPFQVAEAAAERDSKKAMNLLSIVYRTMGDEAHVPLSFSLIKQVEKLIVARHLLDRGVPDEEIAVAVGMHPWRCKNYFLPNVRKHTFGALVSCMSMLRKLDADVKGPARSKRTRVELAVLSLVN